jgi:hypothetical protein
MTRLRLRAVIAALALALVVSSQGCGTNENRDGPPFEPGDIDSPRSLQITNSDVEEVGRSTPYGVVLSWWQAMQRKDVAAVQRLYAGGIGKNAAKRQIRGLQSPRSQPINPDVQTQGRHATVGVDVRAATRFSATPSVVTITDYPASLFLVRTPAGWRLRHNAYRLYAHSRQLPRLAGQ